MLTHTMMGWGWSGTPVSDTTGPLAFLSPAEASGSGIGGPKTISDAVIDTVETGLLLPSRTGSATTESEDRIGIDFSVGESGKRKVRKPGMN